MAKTVHTVSGSRLIVIDTKPEIGLRDRVCRICGDNYFGGNFVCCQECAWTVRRFYTVAETWRV